MLLWQHIAKCTIILWYKKLFPSHWRTMGFVQYAQKTCKTFVQCFSSKCTKNIWKIFFLLFCTKVFNNSKMFLCNITKIVHFVHFCTVVKMVKYGRKVIKFLWTNYEQTINCCASCIVFAGIFARFLCNTTKNGFWYCKMFFHRL